MDNTILKALLARIMGANPAFLGTSQIGDAMTAGLNNPQLNAALASHLPPQMPNQRVAGGFRLFDPAASQPQAPMLPTPPMPGPPDMGPPALSHAAIAAQTPPPAPVPAAPVPMPQARPSDAPAPMSFWQRNAAMMQDPSSGAFIDPSAAADAQQGSGPDVIAKLMDFFHKKDNPET